MDKQYAIVSPGMGIKEDMPAILLRDVYTPGDPTLNVLFERGYIRKAKGRTPEFVVLPDEESVIMLSHFQQTTGERFLLAASKTHIYVWDNEHTQWTDITGDIELTGKDYEYWSFTQYGDYLLMSNGNDKPLVWSGTGDIEELGGSPPIGKYITNFKNYVVLGNLQDAPHKIAWSAIGEYNNWTDGDAGEAVVSDTAEIMGFAQTTDYLIIFKREAIYLMHFVGGDLVFNIYKRVERVGCYSPNSITVLNNKVYFFGANKRLYLFDGIEARDISEGIQDTLSRVKEENFNLVYGLTLDSLNRIVWIIPEGDVEKCNKMLAYDVGAGSWFKYDIGGTVMGIGGYTLEGNETWETYLNRPTITWKTVDPDLRWKDINYAKGERVQIIGDSDGSIYRLFASTDDIGVAFPGTFVTKKVEFGSPNIVRRVLKMQHYFKNEGVDRTVSVSARINNDSKFQGAVIYSLNGGEEDEFIIREQYVDYVCKTLQLQISGNDFFQYLGTIFYYKDLGLR